MSENFVFYPDRQQLESDVDRLYQELVDLVVEKDELELIECPRVSDAYLLQFGSLEYRCQHAEYQLHRLERKLQMMDGHPHLHDRNELALLEHRLDREFETDFARLEAQRNAISDMLARRSNVSADATAPCDFRATYRQIVRRVHPDLHPLLCDYGHEHYSFAREAFRTGDFLATMLLQMMYSDIELDDERFHTTTWLLQRRTRLQQQIASMREIIRDMMDDEPLRYRAMLDNEEMQMAHRTHLQDRLDTLETQITTMQKQVSELLSA